MFEDLLARIATALDHREIPYMVIGGQAVLVHGEPRLTRDIDITLGADTDQLEDVVALAQEAGLTVLVDPEEFARRTMVLPCRDEGTQIRVDFVFSFTPYEREAIGRGVRLRVGSAEVVYASAEDLVVHKLLAGRPRDIEDVRGVLARQPGLDRDSVRRALGDFDEALGRGLVAAFEELLRDPG